MQNTVSYGTVYRKHYRIQRFAYEILHNAEFCRENIV